MGLFVPFPEDVLSKPLFSVSRCRRNPLEQSSPNSYRLPVNIRAGTQFHSSHLSFFCVFFFGKGLSGSRICPYESRKSKWTGCRSSLLKNTRQTLSTAAAQGLQGLWAGLLVVVAVVGGGRCLWRSRFGSSALGASSRHFHHLQIGNSRRKQSCVLPASVRARARSGANQRRRGPRRHGLISLVQVI